MFLKSEDICHVTALAAILNTDVQQIALLYTNSKLTHIQCMEWAACHVTYSAFPSIIGGTGIPNSTIVCCRKMMY